MKSRFWNVFRVIVGISSLPLTFLMIFFSGSKQFGWISNLSLVILFSFGLIGGVCGFIIYGIKRQPGPLSNYLRPRQPLSAYKRNLLVFFLLLSCLAAACFVYGILFLINGGGDIQVNTGVSFLIPKPGEYTLWASFENLSDTSVPTLANELQIIPDQDNKIVQKESLFGQAIYRTGSKKFLGICNFQFPASGSYHLLTSDKQRTEKIILNRSISFRLVLLTLSSFLVSSSSMLFSVYLVWSGRIVFPKAQG